MVDTCDHLDSKSLIEPCRQTTFYTPKPHGCNLPNRTHQDAALNHREAALSNDTDSFKAAGRKILVPRLNHFIKMRNRLADLRRNHA